MRVRTIRELADRYAYGTGPIHVSPREWFEVIYSVNDHLPDAWTHATSQGRWPLLFGRQFRCDKPKKNTTYRAPKRADT